MFQRNPDQFQKSMQPDYIPKVGPPIDREFLVSKWVQTTYQTKNITKNDIDLAISAYTINNNNYHIEPPAYNDKLYPTTALYIAIQDNSIYYPEALLNRGIKVEDLLEFHLAQWSETLNISAQEYIKQVFDAISTEQISDLVLARLHKAISIVANTDSIRINTKYGTINCKSNLNTDTKELPRSIRDKINKFFQNNNINTSLIKQRACTLEDKLLSWIGYTIIISALQHSREAMIPRLTYVPTNPPNKP